MERILLEKSSREKKRIVKVKEKDKTISRKKKDKRSKRFLLSYYPYYVLQEYPIKKIQ